MPVTERFEDPGQWLLQLDPEKSPTPDVLEQIVELGHIVVTDQWFPDVWRFAEADVLAAARYTGVVLLPQLGSDELSIWGQGLVWHLADAEGRGPMHARDLTFSAATLSELLSSGAASGGLLPPSIQAGTITNTDVGTYDGTFYAPATSLDSIRTVMEELDCHFRINPDGTIDSCLATRDDVYTVTSPTHVSVRRGWGTDPVYESMQIRKLASRRDASGWVSRSVLVEERYDGTPKVSAFRNVDSNPYFDLHGNQLVRNAFFDRPASDTLDVDTFLTRQLEQFDVIDEQRIDDVTHIRAGQARVGDYVAVYDPPSGFFDSSNEIRFRGMTIWPKFERMILDQWPFKLGMGVYYRPGGAAITTADWLDLTRFVLWEEGAD